MTNFYWYRQLEYETHKPGVGGSNPPLATKQINFNGFNLIQILIDNACVNLDFDFFCT